MVRASFQNIWTWAYIVDYNISKRNVGILQKKKIVTQNILVRLQKKTISTITVISK